MDITIFVYLSLQTSRSL